MAAGPGRSFRRFAKSRSCTRTALYARYPVVRCTQMHKGVEFQRAALTGNYRWGCAVLYSPRRAAAIPYAVCDWGCPVTIDEHSARRIHELEETVRVLEDQNVQLKIAAREFGALAERLNARLMAESRRSWRVSVREAVAGIAGQVGFSRLRT